MQELLPFLVHLSVRSAALAVVAAAGIWIFRAKSAAVRHAVWTTVVAGMFAMAVLSPILPRVAVPVLQAAKGPVYEFPEAPSNDLVQAVVTPSAPAGPERAVPGWRDAAAAIYFLGVLFFLARLAFGYLFTLRLVRAATAVEDPVAENLYESTWISVPLTVGWIPPRILLPAGWRGWESSKLEAVLAHERTHIQRADWAISLCAGLNRCVFWFHPLSWWAERTLASLAEEACDDAALLQVSSAHYAQALLDMAAAVRSGQGRLVWEAMAMAKAAEVKQRIERILDETRQIPQALTRARWAALLACTVPVVYLAAALEPVPAEAQSPQRTQAEIGEFLKGKRQFSASDVSVMEQYLASNPNDLALRSQLVLYYFAHEMPDERNAHIVWLITNHPEADAALIASNGISPRPNGLNTRAEYERVAGLWKQQAAAHAGDWRVLDHAAQFFSQPGADYNEAERLLLDIKKLEPAGHAWDEKLGKLYAKAILGATGDPAFPNSAPDMAARLRTQLETSSDGSLLFYTSNALHMVAQRPEAGRPLPPGVLNLDDHGLLLPAIDFGERLKQRAADLGVRTTIISSSVNGQSATAIAMSQAINNAPAPHASYPPAPAPVNRVEPEYPPLARQARIQGVVKLAIRVGASGSMEEMTVISGHPLMVPAALEAARKWTFPSGSEGRYLLDINFSLPPGLAQSPGLDDAQRKNVQAPTRIRVGSNVQASGLIHKVDPVYPANARAAGIDGAVALQVVINEDGTVQTVDPVDGHPLLLAAAADAIRQWAYRPTMLNGSPVQVSTTVTLTFDLSK